MLNKKTIRALFVCCIAVMCLVAAYGKERPTHYKIRVDAADLTGFDVEMTVERRRPGLLRVAMAVHPEYDDRYFRYIENFSASDGRGQLSVTREEDTVWRIENASEQVHIRYRLRLPAQKWEVRDAWKPFLTREGGMVGDLHSLMYVVGEENRRARLDLEMPAEWTAASGLEPTDNPRSFTGSTELMLDSPIMFGKLQQWNFVAAGVPHNVVMWSASGRSATDPSAIVDGIKKLVNESIRAFGRPPYGRYAFLLQDGGQAALEHQTSVNIGTSSLGLEDLFEEIAHEYIHVWNLMDVRPKTRVGIRYRFADPTGVLWWSEGATIMFSDLLVRRGGIPRESRSRIERLESLMARYFSSPGYSNQSAETVSRGDSHPEILGDNWAGTHLQGELLVAMIDLEIRSETENRRNTTDVMRLLAARFDSGRGIDNADIERAVGEVCGCDKRTFFRDHIYGARVIDFNRYLALIGLRSEVRNIPSVDGEGRPAVDLRIVPLSFEGADFKVRIMNPESIWAKSGIRTGDTVITADGEKIATWQDFRGWLSRLKIGDTARLVIRRDGTTRTVEVPVSGFERAVVRISELKDATAKQVLLRNAWLSAN